MKGDTCCICGKYPCKKYNNKDPYCRKHYSQMSRGGIRTRTIFDPNEIIDYGDYAEIVIYSRDCKEKARTLIDSDKIELVKRYKWSLNTDGYVSSVVNKKRIFLSHLILGYDDSLEEFYFGNFLIYNNS